MMENEFLKVGVSRVGGKLASLEDKLRGREEVKISSLAAGMNNIRAIKLGIDEMKDVIDEMKDVFEVVKTTLPDGSQKITAEIVFSKNDDGEERSGRFRKEYVLLQGSSVIEAGLEIINTGKTEIGLIPWVRHLINVGAKELPEQAFMSQQGAFSSTHNQPWNRAVKIDNHEHYFPADGWTSRVVLPLEDGSNTLFTITAPKDIFKFYNWRKPNEDFGTQEMIASPLFVPPGETRRWNYVIGLAAPVLNLAYISPELLIGCTPHPTWVPAGTKSLTLEFAATRDLRGIKVDGALVPVGDPGKVLQKISFELPGIDPRTPVRHGIPVTLEDRSNYQLRLRFLKDGKPFHPAGLIGDEGEAVIPLVVGEQKDVPVVFEPKANPGQVLRKVEPRERTAKLVADSPSFEVFAVPSSQRVFKTDSFNPDGRGPVELHAAVGEYESLQLAVVRKSGESAPLKIETSPLTGPGGVQIPCEGARRFLYVRTETPSGYKALYPVGEYPEALLPAAEALLEKAGNLPLYVTYRVPEGTKPGIYRGSVHLSQAGQVTDIPVEMTVWNFAIPKRSPYMQFASSLKGNTLAEARRPDGTPFSREEQLAAIEEMHLKYRLTPCDGDLASLLLGGKNREAFEAKMRKFVDAGATKIYLGNIPGLLKAYRDKIPQIEAYLKEKGWVDYFYVRPGFDEASPDKVPAIAEVCREWKKVSSIPIMETYYPDDRANELFGLLDIYSRNFPAPPWYAERQVAGDRFWKVNAMPGELEVEPWNSARRRYVGMWDNHFTGSYNWTVKFWSGVKKWGEDHWVDSGVGNLAAILMWPHETGILSTIRLESMRDGLEDNAALWMLREKVESLKGKDPKSPAQAEALAEARKLIESGPLAPTLKSAEDVEALRLKVGNLLSALNSDVQP